MSVQNLCYETPQTLYEKYPQVQFFGWNASRIGMFLNAYLVLGLHKDQKRLAQIDERSFTALIKFTNSVVDEHKVHLHSLVKELPDLMTPSELIDDYPQLNVLGWTPTKIGVFLSCKLLVGCHKGMGRSCLITRTSLIRLVEHANGTTDRRKVIL